MAFVPVPVTLCTSFLPVPLGNQNHLSFSGWIGNAFEFAMAHDQRPFNTVKARIEKVLNMFIIYWLIHLIFI